MREDLSEPPLPPEAVPHLRYLKRLVTGLAVVMGAGILAIVVLLWLRLAPGVLPALPDVITLPAGTVIAAVTFARDWTVVVTAGGQVLLYDKAGTLRQSVDPQP